MRLFLSCRLALLVCVLASVAVAQNPAAVARTYLVKLSVPVSTKRHKPGDRIRAAVVSPESLLNGYLEGTVREVRSKAPAKLVLHFDKVVYKDGATAIESEVVDFVNSKGHKSVDDDERPIQLEKGAFQSPGHELWLDEGSELRVKATPVHGR